MRKVIYLVTTLTAFLIFNSCGKKGDPGPAGPPGTANVIYSDWITPATYVKTTQFGTTEFSADIPDPQITQAVVDSGAVLVYARLSGYNNLIWPPGQVGQMPVVINYQNIGVSEIDTWSALITPGKLRIALENNNNVYNSVANEHQFRYVIIPGGMHEVSKLNIRNYEEVRRVLHLKD